MGSSGDWFKNILSLKKTKRKKLEHVSRKPNGSKHMNGASSKNAGSRLTRLTEDVAATRIQCAFRSYKARKSLRRLKGISRFRGLIEEGFSGKNQASSALSQIHFWSKIQADIKARWLGMVAEGKARQKNVEKQIKLQSKLHELEVEWHCGPETVEEILNRIHQREAASAKRERAMAYAFSHQWRANNTGQYFGQAYYDLSKDGWGWSWKERWIAVRPWENRFHARTTTITNKAETTNTTTTPTKKVNASKPVLSDGKKVSPIRARNMSSKVTQEEAA